MAQKKGKKKALDLFSGTKSVGNKLREMGYQVVSLDINKRSKPDLPINILDWEYRKDFAPGDFELVAASVPCNEYSQAKRSA
jgi:site-specific DNA-cytosine methylase